MRVIIFISLMVNLLMISPINPAHAARGIKKTVAVFDFQNDSGYSSKINLGQDFSTQLSDALVQSGKFIVLSRDDLDVVMAEQDLAESRRFAKSNTAKTGKIIPAQILIKGKITEFEEETSGGGQGLSVKGFTIGAKKTSAHVAVIVQLIDSQTGEIINSKRVEGSAKSGGFTLGYSGEFDIDSSNFKKTPLGKAIQIAIDNAVEFVGRQSNNISWRGKVILVKNNIIYINAGENMGVKVGDNFSIYRKGEVLIDPDTGIELGYESEKIAEIDLIDTQEKFSKAKMLGNGEVDIIKGDIVKE